MKMITEWTRSNDQLFADAVAYIRENVAEGGSLEWTMQHCSELFGITIEALRHEYALRSDG